MEAAAEPLASAQLKASAVTSCSTYSIHFRKPVYPMKLPQVVQILSPTLKLLSTEWWWQEKKIALAMWRLPWQCVHTWLHPSSHHVVTCSVSDALQLSIWWNLFNWPFHTTWSDSVGRLWENGAILQQLSGNRWNQFPKKLCCRFPALYIRGASKIFSGSS